MKEYHANILFLLYEGWTKKKENVYYIVLENKDGNVQRKISLKNGVTVSQKITKESSP